MLSTLTMFIVMKSYHVHMQAKQQLKYYDSLKEYTNNLEHVYTDLRAFKHDYINIMASLSSYLEEKQYDELEDYFYTYILPLKKDLNKNTEALNCLMNVHSLEIKSLLTVKLMYGMGLGVHISIDIPEGISTICMNPVDLTRILGIYLDNAIEAAVETDHPVVNFHMAPVNNCVAILISNTFIDKGLRINDMNQLHVSTKGENHGIGLHNVSQILSNYENIFRETYIEDFMFYQHLQIENT